VLAALIIAALWYPAISLATFFTFALDKLKAKQRELMPARRISEKTLHTLSLLGGFPGALLAMHLVRHKTHKPLFRAIALLSAALHACLWLAVIALLWIT
jgi:uncharacterized membrane protein YsdA (DUF1294 family)